MSNKKQLTFEAIAIKGNVAYASDYNRNGLFKVDMNTGECKFVRLFDGESISNKRLHCTALWVDSKIYFIPASASRIAVFCPENNTTDYIEIPLPSEKVFPFYKSQFKFIRAIKNEDDLWLIPCSYPGIIKLNINNGKIQIFNEWLENDEYFFRMGVAVEDSKIIIANGKSNAVLLFDFEKESGEIEHIGTKNNGVMSICKVGNNYWFAPRLPGAIVEWDPINKIVMEHDDYPKGFEEGNIVFSKVYNFSDKVIFIPAKANVGLIYDRGINNFDIWLEREQGTIEYLFETDTERYFREISTEENDRCFKINKRDNTLLEYGFYCLDDGERDRCLISMMSNYREIVRETKEIGLKELINGLM